MVMLMYTSGSTGTPKGAIIHEAICVAAWTTPRSAGPMVAFIFAPMNHSLGRYALYSALGQGGTAYFTQRSDLSTMLEDLQLARPTSMVMIPRMCELAQQHHLSEVSKRIASGMDVETADRAVRAEMRHSFLGDRLVSASVGSAPTTPELRQFMSDVFEIALIDGYGNTESGGGGITVDGHISPAVLDFKLIDVPELGYYVTDRPFPRGELLVKTRTMISGYYKRPEATAAIFDPDGFLKTGDVMEQRGPRELPGSTGPTTSSSWHRANMLRWGRWSPPISGIVG
jgi:fatty acid CoA ligase FadD9